MAKRPTNFDVDSEGSSESAGWLADVDLPKLVPQRKNGDVDPEHYRVRLARVTLVAEAAASRGMPVPFNLESVSKMIEREANLAGIDTKTIADARTDADKIRDAVDKLCDQPDSIWELTDDEIELLETTMEDRILKPARELMEKRASATLSELIEARIETGKIFLNRLRRVRRLRMMAKHPFPKKQLGLSELARYEWEATHVLRFMVYVSRSSTMRHKKSKTGASYVYMIGPPHVTFAVDTWIARTGVMFHKGKMDVGACRPKKGVMLIAPPGHGKPLSVDTPVTTSFGKKKLQDIVVGDMVQTHTGKYQKVTEVHEQGVLPTVKIITESGRKVVSALDHPFLTSGGWKYASELKTDDLLRIVFDTEPQQFDRIVSIDQHEPTKCKCLTVDVDHTFLANDIVVHNSDFASHYLAHEIDKNPLTQSMYVHAVADKACDQKAYIASLFSQDTPAGRRNYSLYGIVLDKTDNNKTKMRVKLQKRTKSPTITACGMSAATLGADTTFQVFDDIVPQSDVDQPTERERRFRILGGTFSTRQRGSDTFKIFIGTLWHYADALSLTWKSALKNDTLVLSKQTTGGPRAGRKGVFEPLWPEVYPASELSRRFDEMRRNYAIWSANYMGDPVSEEMRLIRKLRLYDPSSDSHTNFLASAVYHLSCDPTATSKETSDKAGIVYAAVGEVPVVVRDAHGDETVAYHRRMRILDHKQIHASQTDLADAVAAYTNTRPVFQVHVETRGGYHATADIIQNKYGIECIRHDPKSMSKEIRLKQCAGAIDAGLEGMDPLVEFPGIRAESGDIVPNEQHKSLYQQFLDFGFSEDDHLLDCITQLVNHLLRSGDLVAGSTATTIVNRTILPHAGDPRVKAMLDMWANPGPKDNDQNADWNFIGNKRNDYDN